MLWSLPMNEGGAVFTGTSESLLLHPSEFIESRKEADAMATSRCSGNRDARQWVVWGGSVAQHEACLRGGRGCVEGMEVYDGRREAFRGAAAGDTGDAGLAIPGKLPLDGALAGWRGRGRYGGFAVSLIRTKRAVYVVCACGLRGSGDGQGRQDWQYCTTARRISCR
jgi:hypothetical protein